MSQRIFAIASQPVRSCLWLISMAMFWTGIAMTELTAVGGEPTDNGTRQRAAGGAPGAAARPSTSDTNLSPEAIENVTLEFVREHQPEMAKLLEFLKARQSPDYLQAINESYKVRNRLRTIKDRDPELYEVELDIWKNSANMRLWAATASAKKKKLSEEDLASLKRFVTREHELNIKRLEIEKSRAEARLSQLSQQLSKRREQSENSIAKGVKAWENRIERSQSKSKNKTSNTKP